MATQSNSQKGKAPEYEVFQIVEIEGRDKGKFYPIGVGFTNTNAADGSINLMTIHGKLQIRVPKPKAS